MTPTVSTPPAEAERIEQSARVIASAIGWSYDDLHEDKQAYIAAGGQGITDVNGPYKADLRDAAREVVAAQRPAAPVDRETVEQIIKDAWATWWQADDGTRYSKVITDAILAHLSAQPRVAVPEEPVDAVVIWSSEHSAYWRLGGAGYASDVRDAGLYTKTEGENILRGVGAEKRLSLRRASYQTVRVVSLALHPTTDAGSAP